MTHSKTRDLGIILLLGTLSVITPFAIDMYLPSFSLLAVHFNTTTPMIAWSLSSYFIGFGLGQVLYGPFLDRYGRKTPLFIGLTIYILAALGCTQAHTIETLIALRFLQALGGCAAQVAALAMVRDFFPVKQSAKIFSLLFLIIGVSPLLAPTIGGWIVTTFGWQWVFVLLGAIAAAVMTLIALLLPEGHRPDPTISLNPIAILKGFGAILAEPHFRVYALSGAFSFAGLFTYVAGSPIIFMDGFHVSAQTYGWIFAVLAAGFIGSNQVNVMLLRKFTSAAIYTRAVMAQVVVSAVFVIGTAAGWFGLAPTLILLFVFLSCTGLTYPNAAALALAPFSKNAGSASAMLGFFQMGTGALVSTGVGFVSGNPRLAIIAILCGTASVALVILMLGKNSTRKPCTDMAAL